MIRVYVQNKPLLLVDTITPEIENHLGLPGTHSFEYSGDSTVEEAVAAAGREKAQMVILKHKDARELFRIFRSRLKPVRAAGGLVLTKEHLLLLIFRRGKWDLPKGKLDEGEALEACALREVEEETGAKNLQITQPLHITYHTYVEKGKNILKESHWYLMKTASAQTLKPQTEEDIEKCEWVQPSQLGAYTGNMHASVIDVLNKGMEALANKPTA